MRQLNLLIKRLFDFFASLLSLILLSPLFILISIWIKLDSAGPVFFKQERLGKLGKPFKVFKFRSMVMNAEKMGDGIRIKEDTDPRITRSGKFLRKTSLDELPQLINVIIGQMSLVGPRPPVVYHPYVGFLNYPEWSKIRFDFRPGITGLTQVTVRNSVDWDDRMKVDVKYIREFNIFLDIKILFLTILKVIKPDSLYLEG